MSIFYTNSIIILCYDSENIILTYGLWDQIRVDHGKEFYLMLFIQEVLAHLRRNVSRAPHMQSTSRQVYILYFIANVIL